MEIEFDADKDTVNLIKHGAPLAFGERVFDDENHLVIPTLREGDEEDRYKVVGAVDGRLWTGVHVYRGDAVRFLSVRRSNTGERRAYDRNSRGSE